MKSLTEHPNSETGESTSRCILFDLDGTLYDSPAYSKQLEFEISKFVADKLSVSTKEAAVILKDRRRLLITLTGALESLGIGRAEFFDSITDRIEPAEFLARDDSVQSTISSLKRNGFKVGLVSNSGRGLVEKILKALQLDNAVFDVIVTSSDVKPKPSAEPYLLALRLLGCQPEHSVYVGDRDEAELHPAKQLGIRTVLVNRGGNTPYHWADVTVTRISEIPRAIKEMFPA